MSNLMDGLRTLIASAVENLATAFFIFGDVMLQLKASGLSNEQAREQILSWAGRDVKARTGLSLSAAYLKAAHDAAELFLKEGGLASPDGKHRVSRAEFQTLPMKEGERNRIVELLKLSAHLPKGLRRLRVSDIKEAVTAKDKAKAMSKLMTTVAEVEAAIQLASFGSPLDMAHHALQQARAKTLTAYNNFLKAREAEAEAEAEYEALRELRASADQPQAQAPKAEPVSSSAQQAQPKRSHSRKAEHAAPASA